MGVRILTDTDENYSAIYCSTSMTAFGPVFSGSDSAEDAEAFLKWLSLDAREYSANELETKYAEFITLPVEDRVA